MKKAYIDIAGKWAFVFAHHIEEYDLDDLSSWLEALGAKKKDIKKACHIIMGTNNGFTFSNDSLRMSVMAIGQSSSKSQFMNTIAHEIDHLRYDICKYYEVEEGSEESAYLTGYIMQGIIDALIE